MNSPEEEVMNSQTSPEVEKVLDNLFNNKYGNPVYQQFKEEAEAAGFTVEHYNGRWFYSGPSVSVDTDDEYEDLIRATKVRLQWDNLGFGKIVYPK